MYLIGFVILVTLNDTLYRLSWNMFMGFPKKKLMLLHKKYIASNYIVRFKGHMLSGHICESISVKGNEKL